MKKNTPSKAAFIAVVILGGALFFWWAKSRPSYLLYQAHSDLGRSNSPAVIARYEKILQSENLPPAKEIEYRLALGRFFINAGGAFGTVVLKGPVAYSTENPYLDKAKEQFKRVLELDPENPEAFYLQGRLLLGQGLIRFAEEELKKSHQAEPRYPEPLILLSLINTDWEKAEAARDYALQALAVDPSKDEARWALTLAQGLLGEREKAMETYEDISSSFKARPGIRSRFAFYLLQENKAVRAEREIQEALNRQPDDHWVRLAKAKVHLYKNQPDRAVGELVQAAELDKNSPWPMVWAAEANWQRGACGSSPTQFNILSEVLPRWPWTYQMGAWTSLCQGNAEAALGRLNEALNFSPKFREALFLKASLLMQMERFSELGRLLRPLLDQNMFEGPSLGLVAESLSAQGEWDLAEETALQALGKDPEIVPALLALSKARFQKRDSDGARRALDRALKVNPFSGKSIAAKALFLLRENSADEAESFLLAELKQHSRSPEILSALGWVLLKKKNPSSSVQFFQRAISAAPWFVEAHAGLSDAFLGLGDKGAASRAVSDGLEINPLHPGLLLRRTQLASGEKS